MKDCIIRATDKENHIRLFVAQTKKLVEEARRCHHTSPLATVAFGRLLTVGAIMGAMMKGDKDSLTLQVRGDGPIETILVTSDAMSRVKGYVGKPSIHRPLKEKGQLDIAGAVGQGTLTVIKDMGMKKPYNGTIELVSGEISDDLIYYFASSEQTPSIVALDVSIATEGTVKESGGFVLQLMPDCPEEKVQQIEKNLSGLPPISDMLNRGLGADGLLAKVLEGFEIIIHKELPTAYYCDCNREKVEKALMTIGESDLQSLIDEGEEVNMSCHFCNKTYTFTVNNILNILNNIK